MGNEALEAGVRLGKIAAALTDEEKMDKAVRAAIKRDLKDPQLALVDPDYITRRRIGQVLSGAGGAAGLGFLGHGIYKKKPLQAILGGLGAAAGGAGVALNQHDLNRYRKEKKYRHLMNLGERYVDRGTNEDLRRAAMLAGDNPGLLL